MLIKRLRVRLFPKQVADFAATVILLVLKQILIRILIPLAAFAVSAVLLSLIHVPANISLLAWIAIVPFILACSPKTGLGILFSSCFVIATCYWLGNLYWIRPVTPLGWLAFCFYTALLWPVLAVALRFCRIKRIPLFLAVPVLFVGAERLQGLFLGGFFWRFLAHSQYANITLIQIADIFGAAGLSFLIAMVNGLLAELILDARERKLFKVSNFVKTAMVCFAVAATIVYGRWRINQSDEFVESGPLVASVQSNVPQSVKQSFQSSDEILEQLLQESGGAAEAGPVLIVWPETMVQATLDPRLLRRLSPAYHCKIVDEKLKEHAKDTAFVLVGGYGGTPLIREDLTIDFAKRYNSAFLYRPDGTIARQQYSKIHLVAFGEFVPFEKSCPWLYNLLMGLTPYDYDYTLDAGEEYTVFEIAGTERQVYKFGVMICYEDAVPAIARRFALDSQGQKQLDWLVNISNDGWFVRSKEGQLFPSTELAQHTAVCVFRAVETRLAVLRSVNTGISCLIDTLGRVRNGFVAGTLPDRAMERQAVAGWFADRVPMDSRITFFSKYGQWLDFCCAFCLVSVIIVSLLGWFLSEKKPKGVQGRPK